MNPEPLEICLDKVSGNEFFDEIRVDRFTRISFYRTLRIPEDGRDYPLPAGLGRFPIHRIEDYANKVPSKWLKDGGFFIPLYQREALFIQFQGAEWNPNIAKVCVGSINAISGDTYSSKILGHKQDYVLIPSQKWLDGINTGNGTVRQFVAMPTGSGYSIESQIIDEETIGGFQIEVTPAKEGIFNTSNPELREIIKKIRHVQKDAVPQISMTFAATFALNERERKIYFSYLNLEPPSIRFQPAAGHENDFNQVDNEDEFSMSVAAGGSIKQNIIKDIYGADTWDTTRSKLCTVRIVNSVVYQKITGQQPPRTPISKEDYQINGIPWFSSYDECSPKINVSKFFTRIMGVSAIDKKRGLHQETNEISMTIDPTIIQKIRTMDASEAAEKCRARAYEFSEKLEWKRALSQISNAIDLSKQKKESDYTLRCYCNFNLGNFTEGEVDGSLGLEINPESKEARSWRAYCRLSMGDHEGLKEDAEILVRNPETSIFGIHMRAEAALLSGDYQDAINDALRIVKIDPNHQRATRILTEARSLSSAEAVQENFKFDQ
jgi:tetratricopeptide (TPR) repeat protein